MPRTHRGMHASTSLDSNPVTFAFLCLLKRNPLEKEYWESGAQDPADPMEILRWEAGSHGYVGCWVGFRVTTGSDALLV